MFGKKTNKVELKAVNNKDKIFKNVQVGRVALKPLSHKDGTPFKDYEYFELLGRKCEELEKINPNPNLPVNYQQYGFDITAVNLAKKVCEAIDENRPISEIETFVSQSIIMED